MISVIMLTYNREKLLPRAIEAIQKQTFQDFEYIIINNGSTDNSAMICDKYAKEDSRIVVEHCTKGTIGYGRNKGLEIASGQYIAFIDDDDWCDPDYLEFLYEMIKEYQADVTICAAEKEEEGTHAFVGSEKEKLIMTAEESIITLMWRKYYSTGFPAKLISSELFHGLKFLEGEKYDDISMMYKVLANAEKVVYQGVPKYHIYRHDGNNSAITTKDSLLSPDYLRDYRKAYRDRTNWLCERFPDQKDYWWYFDWSFQISMINKIISGDIASCRLHLEQMLVEMHEVKQQMLQSPYILDFEKEWMEKYIKEN